MNTNQTNQATACLKIDFAQRYFPGLKPASALKKLQLWIKDDPELYRALYHEGRERLHDHYFSPRQLQILSDYFGEP